MNHPESIDIEQVQNLIYETVCDLLIIEGLFPLIIPDIQKQLDVSIYLDVPADIRLGRKIIRKLEEKQTPPQIVFRNYLDTVRNRHFEFIEPCTELADIVINGTADIDSQLEPITKLIDADTKKQ